MSPVHRQHSGILAHPVWIIYIHRMKRTTTHFFQLDFLLFAVGAGDVLLDSGEHSVCVGKSGHVLRGHVHYEQ